MYRSRTRILAYAQPVTSSSGASMICIQRSGRNSLSTASRMKSSVHVASGRLMRALQFTIKQEGSGMQISGLKKWISRCYLMSDSSLPLTLSVINGLKSIQQLQRKEGFQSAGLQLNKALSRKRTWMKSKVLSLAIEKRRQHRMSLELPNNFCEACGDLVPNNCSVDKNCFTEKPVKS